MTKGIIKEQDKRYLAFGYADYYPIGAMNDMIDSFNTIQEAIECINKDDSTNHDVYDRVKGLSINIEEYGYKT